MSESDDEDGFDAFNDDTFGDGASTWEEESHEFLVAKATVEEDNVEGQKQQHRQHPSSNPSPFPAKIDDYVMLLQEEMSQSLKLVPPPPPPHPPHSHPHLPPPQGHQAHQASMALPQMNLPLIRSSPFDSLPPMHQRPPWIASQMPQQPQQRFTPNQPPPRYGQQQHFHHQHQQHQQRQYHNQYHHQQQHSHNRRRYNNNNNSNHHHFNNNHRSDASHYNDRNRETFGDELVDAHKQTFREQNQRYYHNNRDHHPHHHGHNNNNNHHHHNLNNNIHKSLPSPSKVLMTPDRVHANRVLNNRRSGDSTGDPGMDMRRNVKYMMTQKENDEYSGLMTATERQWVLQIQLSQLKCENPFVDDYYYTVFNQKKKQQQEQQLKLDASTKSNALSNNNKSESNNDSQSMEKKNQTPTQLKRTEEGPQLLISEYSAPDESNTYTPVQFDNSLGKLQASSVKAPRMAIDIDASNNDLNEGSTSNAQKDSRKYKQTLLELEHLFFLTIEVEDSEKKLAALPTNTTVRNQVESERVEALVELRKRLSLETNVRRYILVRKGKTLLKRVLRHLEQTGVNCVISILFALLPTALRRDRDDHLLPELLPQFIEHFDSSPKSYIIHYLKLLNCGQGTSQGYLPTYRNILSSSSLGVTLLLILVERLDSSDEKESDEILKELTSALKETPIIVPPIKGYSSLGNIDSSEDPGFYRTQMEKIFSLK